MTDLSPSVQRPKVMPMLARFLGSMNLAIMLLVTIAIASVAGTLLRQNEPYQNYLVKFGPYWHEIYQALGLYDVYSSAWFILIMAFLVISTSVCVTRNTPAVLRSLRRYREDIQERALRNLPGSREWSCRHPADDLGRQYCNYLHKIGYRTRVKETEGHLTIAAMKGGSNRIGYLLTHVAIVIICIGGLVDGNLPLKLKILSGQLKIETRDNNIAAIPTQSRLPADNPSFRAGVSIPEGARVNYAFINTGGGFLLQELPFSVLVKDFRIEHYMNGQPKSFESDLVIHDPRNGNSQAHTIAVNHPLNYQGYTLYQSSFGDGGTRLRLRLRPLLTHDINIGELEGIVGNASALKTPDGELQIEFNDFRKFNIFPAADSEKPNGFLDHGPSFTFRIRQPDGSAREYINYQYPIPLEGKYYFLSGVRSVVAGEFQYLYIPVDAENTQERFFRLLAYLHDDTRLEAITRQMTDPSLNELNQIDPEARDSAQQPMLTLLRLFRAGGFDAISGYVEKQVPEAEQPAAIQAYFKLLQGALHEVYREVLRAEGVTDSELEAESRFYFEDAVNAINALQHYGSPFYLQLEDFDEKLATGLQITHTPGKNVVYAGFAMLITGVFLLFYVAHQRLWLILSAQGERSTRVLIAGMRTRHPRQFSTEFGALVEKLKLASGG